MLSGNITTSAVEWASFVLRENSFSSIGTQNIPPPPPKKPFIKPMKMPARTIHKMLRLSLFLFMILLLFFQPKLFDFIKILLYNGKVKFILKVKYGTTKKQIHKNIFSNYLLGDFCMNTFVLCTFIKSPKCFCSNK